jgi:hypothetical protein
LKTKSNFCFAIGEVQNPQKDDGLKNEMAAAFELV